MSDAASLLYPTTVPSAGAVTVPAAPAEAAQAAASAAATSTPNVPATVQPSAPDAGSVAALVDQANAVARSIRTSEPEVSPTGVEYASLFRGYASKEVLAERKQAFAVAAAADVRPSEMAAFVRLAEKSFHPNYKPATEAESLAALRELWGDDTEANVAKAKQFAREIQARWPGLFPLLESRGLGNSPALIQLFYDKAVRNEA